MGWANFIKITIQAHRTTDLKPCLFLREIGLLLLLGFVGYPQSLPTLTPPAQTYIYDFQGYVSAAVPVVPALNLGKSFSIEFWMMLDYDIVDSQYMRVFYEGAPSGYPYSAYELDLAPGTHQLAYSQSTGSSGSLGWAGSAQIGLPLTPGQWYHVAIVSNNLQVTLYLNGQQQATFTAAGPPPINSSPLVLAAQPYGDGTCCGFPGSLRQFRIWGRALKPLEPRPDLLRIGPSMTDRGRSFATSGQMAWHWPWRVASRQMGGIQHG
jgi:hypothetical protein